MPLPSEGRSNMDYRIVEGAENMRVAEVVRLLRMTYWADRRPVETVERSMARSACFGVRLAGSDELVAFARVISDEATTFYLCDVVVDPACRGRGLGTALVSHVVSRPIYAHLRGLLITRDAHGLYRPFGFEVVNDRVMVKAPKG